MQCRTKAILRATAILAFLMPMRLASCAPEALKLTNAYDADHDVRVEFG
jgi:hypothetical protein